MKPKVMLVLLSATGLTGGWLLARPDKPVAKPRPGWCQPYAETCPSCTNCKSCQHCAKKGGKCSVCWDLK